MKAKFLKIAKVKSEKDFYNKYPTEEAFFKAHPEARMMQVGGAPTANQFFDYGMSAKGPLIAPETWYQEGGDTGDQYTEEDENQIPDYQNQVSYDNTFADMLYPDTQQDSEETGESDEEEATEDESSEYAYGGSSNSPLGYFQSGGSKSAFNYGQWPAMKTGGIQGGNIDAVNSSTKENFLSYIRKNVADDMYSKEMGQGMDQDMSQGAPMAQYGYGMGQSGYNPNMYNQDMFQGNIDNQSLNRQEGFNNLRDVFNADLNNRWSQKTNQLRQEDRDKYINQLNDQINNQMAKNVGKPSGDVVSKPADYGQQTIDLGVNTNPWASNTFQKGGIQKFIPKAQKGAQIGLDYTSPNLSIENYDINKIIENSKKTAQNLSQKRKDDEEIKTIQDFKQKRDAALKELSDNPEGYTMGTGAPVPGGLGTSIHATPEQLAKNLKYWDDLYKTVYNSYYKSRNIASPSESYTSQEDYYKHLSDPASPAKTAAQQAWMKSPGYKPVAKAPIATDATIVEDVPVVKTPTTQTSTGTSATTTSAPDQTRIVPKTSGSASFDPNYNPALDTVINSSANYKKGGSLPKAQTGTIVGVEKNPNNNHSKTTYSDGTIVIKDETGKILSTTPGTASASKPTAPVVATTQVATNPATQTVADVSETDARKKAIHDLALAYGVDPNYLQQLVNSQSTGYYGQSAYPYRYHHRGYGNLLADRGDIPDKNQIMAMQAQANQMGYNMKYRHNPLTGRLVIKTKYNPNTGQMEHHPSSNDDSSLSLEQRINQPGWIEDKKPGHINTYNEDLNNLQAQSEISDIDASQNTKQYGGRLGRFLPKHQVGTQTGMGNPQSATATGTPNTMGKKGNEKAVYKEQLNINPYTSDYIEAGMNIGANFLNSSENRNNKARLAKYQTSDYTHPATQKDMGDYVANGQQWGSFRPNQTTPAFDTGYERGNAGDAFSQFEEGGSMSPYSYPSQLPAIPGRNQSDNMSMYTHWNQRPVMAYGGYMQQGGSMYQENGVYNLSDDEINNIIQQGGQVEYLD